ncbi:unnamed protein product [Euphydryas editha]|uniref:Reverse transcriptase n=1 Tax=Euphydryas editha TaxID=104508 RepID=A0AAU9UXF4_EUPED|nr:unnamed protein product [Euphydryas editha]
MQPSELLCCLDRLQEGIRLGASFMASKGPRAVQDRQCSLRLPRTLCWSVRGEAFSFEEEVLKSSHLLYLDDLKLLAPNTARLMELLKTTIEFSCSIRMQLGVDKCAVVHVGRRQVIKSKSLSNFKTLSEAESYRYLGMSQCIGVQEVDMKQVVCEVFFGRLTEVLRSYLSGANKVRAYNGWVIPTVLYTFGVLRWT